MPTARAVFGGFILWAGALPIILLLGWLQGKVLPIPREFTEIFSRVLTAHNGQQLATVLFIGALTPAICEELVFRGVLMQSFRGRWSAIAAITTAALFFGIAHILGGAVFRLLSTTLIGVTIGYASWTSRSIVTGMLIHAVNNGLFIVLYAYPKVLGRYNASLPARIAALITAPILLWIGVRLLSRRTDALAAAPTGASLDTRLGLKPDRHAG